jgi:two-component system, NarL family, nitrate/nitrite response regulator NarL
MQAERSPSEPGDEAQVTVLLVDDQERFRGALRELIACADGFALVGEASSGEEATRAVQTLAPQLVLMDVVMPGMGGIAAARTIIDRRPAPMVVLISVDDRSVHPEASELGASVPYVRKQDLKPARLRDLWEGRPN